MADTTTPAKVPELTTGENDLEADGYHAPPKKSLEELRRLDAQDESLNNWVLQLYE